MCSLISAFDVHFHECLVVTVPAKSELQVVFVVKQTGLSLIGSKSTAMTWLNMCVGLHMMLRMLLISIFN